MSGTLGVTDAFVVTSGRNPRQVRTIVDEVERQVKIGCGRSPLRVEGRDDFGWVLMDYGDFVVHVFLDERRSYYDLSLIHIYPNRRQAGTGGRGPARPRRAPRRSRG